MSAGDPGRTALPFLPRDEDGPVFEEPWQAQAFAMAVRLHEEGHFEWSEWASELGRQISSDEAGHDGGYYEHWLSTLEVMVVSAGLSSDSELAERRDAWQRTAATTPHGQPIEL
jgi:nitrile hydratase accessory protein